jgi:hypothetical protein
VWVADWAMAVLQSQSLPRTSRLLARPPKRERRTRLRLIVAPTELERLGAAVVLRCMERHLRHYAGLAVREGQLMGVSVAGIVLVARVASVESGVASFAVALAEEERPWTPLERALEECFAPLLLPRLREALRQGGDAGRLLVIAGRGARLDTSLLPLLAWRLGLRPLLIEARNVEESKATSSAATLALVSGVEELREDETQPLRAWLARRSAVRRQLTLLWSTSLAAVPGDLRGGAVAVHVPSPSRHQRAIILAALQQQCGLVQPPDAELAESAAGFAVEDLERLAAEAKAHGGDWAAARAAVRPRLLLEAGAEPPSVEWTAVAGGEAVRAALERAIVWPLRHPELLAQFDCAQAGGTLLYGPPGCGKSLCVAAFATSSRINLIHAAASQLLSKYTGETEAQIRQLFARCRSLAPCVLCLDDFEQLAGSREETEEDTGGASQRAVSTLLNELDGVDTAAGTTGVFLVALTSRPWALDAAVLRPGRIDALVYVGPPDSAARAMLLGPGREELVESTEGFSHAAVLAVGRGSSGQAPIDGGMLARYEAFGK